MYFEKLTKLFKIVTATLISRIRIFFPRYWKNNVPLTLAHPQEPLKALENAILTPTSAFSVLRTPQKLNIWRKHLFLLTQFKICISFTQLGDCEQNASNWRSRLVLKFSLMQAKTTFVGLNLTSAEGEKVWFIGSNISNCRIFDCGWIFILMVYLYSKRIAEFSANEIQPSKSGHLLNQTYLTWTKK